MAKLPVANQIRRLRFEHGEMTQSDLAERIGVTRQTIAAIEAGKYGPSLRPPSASPKSSMSASKTCSSGKTD